MRLSFPFMMCLVVGCSGASEQADSRDVDTGRQTVGFTEVSAADAPREATPGPSDAQPPTGVKPKAAEPAFNGGFESRAKGTCTPPPPEKPEQGWACDWPVGMPTGWNIHAPFSLGQGIYVQYAAGRVANPPLPNRTVPDSSAVVAAPCVPGSSMARAQNGCVGTYHLITDVFSVTSGADYRLSAWLRSEQSWSMAAGQKNGVTIGVAWFDSSSEWIRTDRHKMGPDEVPVASWSQDWVDVTAPANAAVARAEVLVDQLGDRFVYVDDVRLEPQ